MFVCRSGRRRRPFCLSRSRCGLPLQPDECLRPRRAKEFRPRVRDAFVSPLRDRSGRDAAKISDFPGPAQRVNDCACVHVRHHRICAVRPQGFFALTKNACILFFSALKLSHRSTAHRASKLFRRSSHRRTHAPRPPQLGVASKTSIGATSTLMGAAAQPASPHRSGPRSNESKGAAQPHAQIWASSTRTSAGGDRPAHGAARGKQHSPVLTSWHKKRR